MNTKMVKIFSTIGILALIIAPLCLMYMDRGLLFPFITGKNFFWRFFVEIALLGWASSAILSARYRFSAKEPFFIGLSIFMGIILLANLLGNNFYLSFWSGAERMDGYISLLHLFGYFIALVGLIRTKAHMNLMLLYLLGIALVISVMGWGEERERIYSTLGNPIYLASLSFFGIFISGYFMVIKEKFLGFSQAVRLVIFGLLAVAFVYTVFRTGTRGALLGLVGGGFTTALLFMIGARASEEKWWRYLGGGIVLVTLVAGGLFFGARTEVAETSIVKENLLLSRVMNVSLEDTTTRHRLANWNMALEGVKERPLLGWGQEHYTVVFSKFYNAEELHDAEQWFDRTHNTFLDWLVFGGVLGLLSYLALFVLIIWTLWKYTDVTFLQKSVFTGLFVGYLFQNLVAFDSLVSGIFLYACFAYVVIMAREEKDTKKQKSGERTFSYMLIIGLIISTGFWMYQSIHLPKKSMQNYISYLVASQRPSAESVTENLPVFKKIFEHETFMTRELVIQAIQQRKRYAVAGVTNEVFVGYLSPIAENTTAALEQHNNPTKLNLLYGVFLASLGAYADAEVYLQTAHEQSPEKLSILWQQASLYEKIGQQSKAEEKYLRAIELAPESKIAQDAYRIFKERKDS